MVNLSRKLFVATILIISGFNIHSSEFDHSYKSFQRVLDKFVVSQGPQTTVKYGELKSNSLELETFLSKISQVKIEAYDTWTSNQKLAFLINAYNAYTLKLIINHYPVKSIKDIGSFFSSPWKKEFFNLFGKKTNLDHIEHGLIRKNFKEPRIHFAVNCASLGCPSLAKKVYTGESLERQLEEAAKNFLTNPNRNRLDLKKKTLYLSKIFDWYGDDFKEMKDYGHIGVLDNFVTWKFCDALIEAFE